MRCACKGDIKRVHSVGFGRDWPSPWRRRPGSTPRVSGATSGRAAAWIPARGIAWREAAGAAPSGTTRRRRALQTARCARPRNDDGSVDQTHGLVLGGLFRAGRGRGRRRRPRCRPPMPAINSATTPGRPSGLDPLRFFTSSSAAASTSYAVKATRLGRLVTFTPPAHGATARTLQAQRRQDQHLAEFPHGPSRPPWRQRASPSSTRSPGRGSSVAAAHSTPSASAKPSQCCSGQCT